MQLSGKWCERDAERHLRQTKTVPEGILCVFARTQAKYGANGTGRSPQAFDRWLPLGQAKKGAGRMPWHWEPMKDVVSCDKPRGVTSRRYIRGFPNGAIRMESCPCIIY